VKIGSAVRPGRVPEKKRTGHDSQNKKSQSGNISRIWGEAPTVPIRSKICMVGSLADVITTLRTLTLNFKNSTLGVIMCPVRVSILLVIGVLGRVAEIWQLELGRATKMDPRTSLA